MLPYQFHYGVAAAFALFALIVTAGSGSGYFPAAWSWFIVVINISLASASSEDAHHRGELFIIKCTVSMAVMSFVAFIAYAIVASSGQEEDSFQYSATTVFALVFCLFATYYTYFEYTFNKEDSGDQLVNGNPADLENNTKLVVKDEDVAVTKGRSKWKTFRWAASVGVIFGATFEPIGLYSTVQKYQPPSEELYQIGESTFIHAQCKGVSQAGSPNIVLMHGLGGSIYDFSWVYRGLAQEGHRVCSYSRVGYTYSSRRPDVDSTSVQIVEDLEKLLPQLNITDNIVFVGHSFAGFNMRLYQAKHPEQVKAIVFVDAVNPNFQDKCGADETNSAISSYNGVYAVGRNILPLGTPRLGAAFGVIPYASLLPEDIQPLFTANLLRFRYYETQLNEWRYFPQNCFAVQQIQNKTLDIPVVHIAAEKGIFIEDFSYAEEIAALNPNDGKYVFVEGSDAGHIQVVFDKKYADIIVEETLLVLSKL